MELPIGTFVNAAAVLAGSLLGIRMKSFLPDHVKKIVFQAIGLFTLVLGIKMSLVGTDELKILLALFLGGISGVVFKLDQRIHSGADRLKSKLNIGQANFSEGMVTAFLIFCVGSMTILGAFNEGLTGDRELLYTKSLLDGITAIVLAASFGWGVAFSIIPLLIFQAGLTLLAVYLESILSPAIISDLKAVGGVLILGIGINILEIKSIKMMSLLPALIWIVLIHLVANQF